MFNIVLVEPEIPPNTGNIGRLCLATDSTLHLIKPLGFDLSSSALQRAGLDYWEHVKVQVWDSYDQFEQAMDSEANRYFLTTKSDCPYDSATFGRGDYLIFGRETKGLPESLLNRNSERLLTIPTVGVRSLNLATAVAIVLFEGVRQLRVRG
jgi:tRNA (cytidine/uridine-2'-O-)-methyltransferase